MDCSSSQGYRIIIIVVSEHCAESCPLDTMMISGREQGLCSISISGSQGNAKLKIK